MGKIKDLIEKFIKPGQDNTFRELALAAGISEETMIELEKTMNGDNWETFSGENNVKEETARQRRRRENIKSLEPQKSDITSSERGKIQNSKNGISR